MNDDNENPIMDGSNGRQPNGRFAPGNAGGPGNPTGRKLRDVRARLDEALFKVCAPDRLVAAVDAILKLAEAGDTQAAKLLFERIAGPPLNTEVAERIEKLEALLQREDDLY